MAEDRVTLNLRVLSPSSEVDGGIHLQDLPTSTTVRELRLKIQDAVASKPGLERMRLIYRGKVVANDADTLETVFGTENLRESKDQSLHLVIRELPQTSSTSSTPVPRIASAPPNPSQPAAASPPLQTNPFRALPQPRPNSQPQVGPQPHHHHHHHAHHPHVHHHHHVQQPLNPLGPLGAMPLPPQMQQQLAQAMGQHQRVVTQVLGTPAPGTPVQPGDAAAPQPAPAEGAPAQAPPPPPAPGMIPAFGGMPAPNGRTVRQEVAGPHGSRWSVTYDFTANNPLRPGQPTMPRPVPLPGAFVVPPRPFASPAPGGVNVPLTWLLPRLRGTLQEAAREVDNVRTLLAPSAVEDALSSAPDTPTFPSWRAERIREHLRTITHNLNMVDGGLSDPAMQLNMDVIALRQTAGDVRRQANEFSALLDAREAGVSAELAQSTSPGSSTAAASDPLVATASAATRTLPPNAPQELFLLSSPQGPVGVLFDQQGTFTTAPFTSSLPSQSFVDQFNQNRQLIANLGQQIAQSAQSLHGHLADAHPTPTPTQQPGQAQPPHQPEAFDQAAAQRVIQNIIQNRNERQAGAQPANAAAPAENDRVANIAGHFWLVFKLACFVYIFAGGGGWYRPLMLGSIAVIVYIVQLGIFEAQLNVVRQHFEALLPNADRLAQGRRANNNQANANVAAAATADARRNAAVTPEEAARRLLLQQRNNQFGWARDAMRTLERGVALFVASLWPGIGERMVHAQEERERLERVAASEERERQEEERRRREEEEAGRQGEDKQDEGVQTGEKQSEHGDVQSSSAAAEKPPLDRLSTQTLSEDFMDDAQSSGEKGKERAVDDETSAGHTESGSAKGKEKAV